MDKLTIPCGDCDLTRQRLEDRGHAVHGCTPLANRPGFCEIAFERPGVSRAMVALAAAAPAAVELTPTQVRTAQAIVNLFETGEVLGRYGQVTVIDGDTGHLTYGRSQTTLGSGNLHDLLARYCANPGARFAGRLLGALPRFAAPDLTLDDDGHVHNLLRACADDRVMREVQDAFFDERYWRPAARAARAAGIATPLGVAVVYDSWVHGSWSPRRREVDAAVGPATQAGERAWIDRYVAHRRAWLAGHPRADLRATTYRMDAFRRLIDQGYWGLELPIVVRGAEISVATLAADPPGCYDGPAPGTRALGLGQPLARGLDVRLLQLGLSDLGLDLRADGVFGQTTQTCLRSYQIAHGLPVTGVADTALVASLAG
jgi:chitosanase